MCTAQASEPFRWISRSEYLSTLPLWRRWLARLNWRPVFEIEQRTKWLELENARLAKIESKLDLLLRNPDSYLQMYPPTDSNSAKP